MPEAVEIPTWLVTYLAAPVTLIGWISAIYFYFKYRSFKKIQYDKEIALLELELKPLEEKFQRSEGFWKAKMASEGALDSTAGREKIRIEVERASKEVAAVKIQIEYYKKLKKSFIDLR